jgi:hypothetical protein
MRACDQVAVSGYATPVSLRLSASLIGQADMGLTYGASRTQRDGPESGDPLCADALVSLQHECLNSHLPLLKYVMPLYSKL